jgi:hypothetical protein
VAETVVWKNGIPIRLTDERWLHITEEHAELAGYRFEVLDAVREPERIVAGNTGELLAIKSQPDGKILVVVYREQAADGFVITAFLTRRMAPLNKRKQIWP